MKAFSGGLNSATYDKWARDPINVGLYNASIEGGAPSSKSFNES